MHPRRWRLSSERERCGRRTFHLCAMHFLHSEIATRSPRVQEEEIAAGKARVSRGARHADDTSRSKEEALPPPRSVGETVVSGARSASGLRAIIKAVEARRGRPALRCLGD